MIYLYFLFSILSTPFALAETRLPSCIGPIKTPAELPCPIRGRYELRGETLFIEGAIDFYSLYDLFKLEGLETRIKRIEFNSFGGMAVESERLAALIRERGIAVNVREGARCDSLCLLLFQASPERSAHPHATFLYHPVILLGGFDFRGETVQIAREHYMERCAEDPTSIYCQEFSFAWHEVCVAETNKFFKVLESWGTPPALLKTVRNQPRDPEAFRNYNCYGRKSLILTGADLQKIGVVQKLTP